MTSIPVLSWITFFPLIGGFIILMTRKEDARIHRILATVFSAVPFALAVWMWPAFDAGTHLMQFVEKVPWISAFNIHYHLGVDGLSYPLVLLTGLLSVISIIAAYGVQERTKEFFFWFLVLETAMFGVFVALDFFLFYVFWEITLVPMYFLIGIWGGPQKEYAAIKFFLFTLFGSVFMLLAMLAIYFASGTGADRTLDLVRLAEISAEGRLQLAGAAGMLVFLALFVGFAVKIPAFPFHTWLPLAHVEAPTPVSVILAGVLLKMGVYGLLRISYPVLPEATQAFLPILVIIGAVNVIYGAFCAMAQTDMKRLVAYSSINHMGYALLGVSAVMGHPNAAQAGLNGAVLQLVNHGIITGALFLIVGALYDRTQTRQIDAFGGLGVRVPLFSAILVVQAMASLGLPGLSGFISEFLCFLGAFGGGFDGHNFRIWAGVSVIGLIVTAAFFLRLIKLVVMGEFNPRWEGRLPDLNARELVTLLPLVFLTVLLGVYPALALRLMDATLGHLIGLVTGAF